MRLDILEFWLFSQLKIYVEQNWGHFKTIVSSTERARSLSIFKFFVNTSQKF